ncbi:unnamed protein product, partial [Urochloa humidicola]
VIADANAEDTEQGKAGTEEQVINEPREVRYEHKEDSREAELPEQVEEVQPKRQSKRLQAQDLGGIKVAEKAELAARKKNLEGLHKQEEKDILEIGAVAMKETALHFHPQDATAEDTGTVLLQ